MAHWTDQAITQLCAQHFGLDVTVQSRLGGELGQNVLLVEQDTRREFVCKIQPYAQEEVAALFAQVELQKHYRRCGIATPHSVPLLSPVQQHADVLLLNQAKQHFFVYVQERVPGVLLAQFPHPSDQLWVEVGTLVGSIMAANEQWQGSQREHQHHWNLSLLDESLAEVIPAVPEPSQRELLNQIYEQSTVAVVQLRECPQTITHHDLNDFNLFADPRRPPGKQITGVIDFGDMTLAPRLSEAAIALAYSMLGHSDPLHVFALVRNAIQKRFPLVPVEVELLLPLALGRLALNAATWTARTQTNTAASDYGQRRMARTWDTLFRLAPELG